jgi:hypothetical protein
VLGRKAPLTPRKISAPLRPARRSGRINIATGGSGGMSLEAILFESKPDSKINPRERLHRFADTALETAFKPFLYGHE